MSTRKRRRHTAERDFLPTTISPEDRRKQQAMDRVDQILDNLNRGDQPRLCQQR